MSTLTYAKLAPAADEKPVRRHFWSRLFDAFVEGQQRRAEREVARYLASRGDLLNDETEREIMRRLAGDTRRPL